MVSLAVTRSRCWKGPGRVLMTCSIETGAGCCGVVTLRFSLIKVCRGGLTAGESPSGRPPGGPAADRGLAGKGADLNLVTDMVRGTMWYRILSRHAPVVEALADEVTEAALRPLGPVGK